MKNSDEDFHKSKEILFVDYLKTWLEKRKNEIKKVTWESYRYCLYTHIMPFFEVKKLHLKDVKPKQILEYYDYKSSAGRADGKIGGTGSRALRIQGLIMNMTFNRAILEGLIETNHDEHLYAHRQPKKTKTFRRFIGAFNGRISL